MLRPAGPDDARPYVQAFADDPDMARNMGFDAPAEPALRKTFKRESRDRAAGELARFAIDAEGRFAGVVLLHTFVWEHLRAELGVMLVPAARGRGMATEAMRLLIDWGFSALGLQRIGLHTLRDNVATQRAAERAGFVREGVLRAYTREWGRPVDNVVFGACPA